MSQPRPLFRPCYRERKEARERKEVDDVEMAIAAHRQYFRAAMELRRELFSRHYRGEPSCGMAVCKRCPAGELLPGRSDGGVVRRRPYRLAVRRLRSVHATRH